MNSQVAGSSILRVTGFIADDRFIAAGFGAGSGTGVPFKARCGGPGSRRWRH
jgi:hypothetical protein